MATSGVSPFQQSISALQRQISLQSQSSVGGSDTDPLCVLPPELVLLIFEFVPLPDVVRSCREVCKGWKQFFDDPQFWQLRMMQAGNFDRRLASIPIVNWPQLCVSSVDRPNLLKNFVGGELSLDPWKISYYSWDHFSKWSEEREDLYTGPHGWNHSYRGGGDRWSIEEMITSESPALLKENEGSCKNYVTSYEWCCREQVVDLVKCGFVPQILDELQPTIEVSEWFCARYDCGSIFGIQVNLLSADYESLQKFEFSETIAQPPSWQLCWKRLEHKFENYGPGVRYVRFADAGKDTRWWAGHYGSKMAAAWVRVRFSAS